MSELMVSVLVNKPFGSASVMADRIPHGLRTGFVALFRE
jgi:hypothetical protein